MSLKSLKGLNLRYQKSNLVPLIKKTLQKLQEKDFQKSWEGLPNDEKTYKCLESLNLAVLIKIYECLRNLD